MRSCNRFSRVFAFASAAIAASPATSPAFSPALPEDSDFFILVTRLSAILISIPQRFIKARLEKLCFNGYVRVTPTSAWKLAHQVMPFHPEPGNLSAPLIGRGRTGVSGRRPGSQHLMDTQGGPPTSIAAPFPHRSSDSLPHNAPKASPTARPVSIPPSVVDPAAPIDRRPPATSPAT
jgi:hypothetical protein